MTDVRDLAVVQVMSRILVAVTPEESPLLAWEIMRRADVHHLPVVEADGRLRGVLTREDLTARWSGGPIEQSQVPVRALVAEHRCPHTTPEARLADAAAVMIGAGVDAIPVLGEAGRLVGMVTVTDVLRAVAGEIPERREPPELMTGVFRLVPVLPPAPAR
ncbi:CBS domain-containing membrane protein [Streptosporangium becharense]|uniref:CBS domain-containing membrane protein n=1 Tax=Streptosporangium becharense TaxID=1816182 RepID=A0A7W9IAC1_9ACTN|nr:CBS domain-containing protein [Streptosporangium becharense]MBB2915611.1 CBS domain-containing membrane protein [Streptosporangium becharense]MBB5817052.1 CBS domain-containing membrane protein [Streptosporangium becharense]